MPRPKSSKALPSFYVQGHKLSGGARAKLIELLGYGNSNRQDPAASKDPAKIILDIETALGMYLDGYQHLDYIPRPADYVAVFKPLYREANKLLNDLCGLSGYYNEQLKLQGMNVHNFKPELASLLDAANAIVKDFENRSSKGAPKKNALMATIRELRCIFRDHYEGPRDDRRRRGAWEHEFVEVALMDMQDARDAAIAEGGGLPRLFPSIRSVDLPRLFRDPRSVPQKKKAARDAKKAGPPDR